MSLKNKAVRAIVALAFAFSAGIIFNHGTATKVHAQKTTPCYIVNGAVICP